MDPDLGFAKMVATRIVMLLVVHTDDDDAIRIVSARKATRAERGAYEDGDL